MGKNKCSMYPTSKEEKLLDFATECTTYSVTRKNLFGAHKVAGYMLSGLLMKKKKKMVLKYTKQAYEI